MSEEKEDKTTIRVSVDLRERVKKLRRLKAPQTFETQEEVVDRLVKKAEVATDRNVGRG